jgi:Flp pilus assembly protein TadG
VDLKASIRDARVNVSARGRHASERGAVLIQVAIAILSLTAFSAFVIDYGVLWVARNQAQNAADAGALAGAIARSYDEFTDPPVSGGKAELSARWAALCASGSASCPATPSSANPVWPSQAGASSTVDVLWDCPPTFAGRCVQVNVYRDGTSASTALPVFMGPLLGITSQGARATASARVASGNAVSCLRPWAIPDKWTEFVNLDQYDRWQKGGIELPLHDVYTPPSATDPGTGYRLPDDYGTMHRLINGSVVDSVMPPGWSIAVNLPQGDGTYSSGSNDFKWEVANCNPNPVAIGDYLPIENMGTGPIEQGFDDLFAKDPGVMWNPSTKMVQNSCAPTCAPFSPRIVPFPVFDVDDYHRRKSMNDTSPCPTGGECVKVINILGFFAASRSGADITGYLLRYPGQFVQGGATLSGNASFLSVIQLIR